MEGKKPQLLIKGLLGPIKGLLTLCIDLNVLQKQQNKFRRIWSKLMILTITRRFKRHLLTRQLQGMNPFQEMIIKHVKKTTALTSVPETIKLP